jgi:hypothetical protein
LERVLRNNRPGRATGNDPFTSDLFHNQAAALAEHAYPLLVKMWAWGEEPIQYKGGPMALLSKKPQPTTVAEYRGILLLPTLAKSFRATLQSLIDTRWQQINWGQFQNQKHPSWVVPALCNPSISSKFI